MESIENGSHNSTRLSMYIRDMPLTPFGMSPTSERKKKKNRKFISTPGSNKLSRKNVKQPSPPCSDNSNKENEETPKHYTNKYYPRGDIESRLPSTNDNSIRKESSLKSNLFSKTSTTSDSQSKEILVQTNSTSSTCALSLQRNSESSHSSERRESVFTDIDDGSFIEFCDIQAKGPVCEPKKPPSSLYYTVESQNETHYSTSTKLNNAAVGFRNYVDAVKRKRALLGVVAEDVDEDRNSINKGSNFLSDLSIVGGSADIVPKYQTKTKKTIGALNSTMMPTGNQPFDFPDISTLTLESDTTNPSHDVSPNYIKRQPQGNMIETIIISESSEDETFMTANKSPSYEEDIEINNVHKVNNFHKTKNHLHMDLEVTCASNMSRSVRATSPSQSLISEDVSIVTSVASQCKTKPPLKSEAPTVVYESVSVLEVPLRRSRRTKETCETSRHLSKSRNNTGESDTSRSKSPIYTRNDSKSKIYQRKRSKRNSKTISESGNLSNSSDNQLRSPRVNYKKISESEDLSDYVQKSPRSNTIQTMCTSNPLGSKHQTVHSERRKKSRSGIVSEVVSDTSEENYVLNSKSVSKRVSINASESEHSLISPRNGSKHSRYVLRSHEVSGSDNNLKGKNSDTSDKVSNHAGSTSESDNEERKLPLRRNKKKVIEESDESSTDAPKKINKTGKGITDDVGECYEVSSDIVPVPKNTPNKYIWKIENNIPKKVLLSDVATNANNPHVKKWVVTSPFKEGSFTSNFLLESNSQPISDTPSQPNPKQINFKFKPSESSLKEKLEILDNERTSVLPKRSVSLEQRHQNVTSVQSNSKRIGSPVDTWVQTSPFKDSSLDSNFLLEEDNSYLSETPSQPKKCDEPNTSSQSLKLRLSEGLDRSCGSTVSEKSKHTLGRIASLHKDVSSQAINTNADDTDRSIRVKRTTRNNIRVIDSDSESSDNSLQKVIKKTSSKNKVMNIKSNNIEVKRSKGQRKGSKSTVGDDDMKEIEKELNKIYRKDWHKNANAVLSSTKKQSEYSSKTKQPSHAQKQNYKEHETSDGSFISDEAEEASDEEYSVDEEEPLGETLDSESDDITTERSNTKHRDRIGSYISVGEKDKRLDDTEKDGLDDYVTRRKVSKVESIRDKSEKQVNDLGTYDRSFINDSGDDYDDDDDEDDSIFVLPTLPQRLTTKVKPQGGSLSSMLLSDEKSQSNKSSVKNMPKKIVKNDKKNNEEKKGKKLWSATTGPLIPLDNKKPSDKEKSLTWRNSKQIAISSDSDDYELPEVDLKVVRPNGPYVPCWIPNPKYYKEPSKTDLTKKTKAIRPAVPPGGATPTQSFLSSLSSNVNHGRCHPDAQIYIKNYKKNKELLSDKLYKYFNEHIFDNKLPESMQIKWNVRMTKSAGFCYYQIDKSKPSGRGARIELSCKVLDKAERLRDTLIHELCHAAAWIISAYKDGHGPLWKAWAAKAMIKFPELPSISRCHSYEITCKFTYRCTKCGYSIGRHSKSLDTNKKVCGYCYGKFEVLLTSAINKASKNNTPSSNTPTTPKTPNPFALFVKENYKTIKKSSGTDLKHGDVMKLLSTEFSKLKAAQ